MGKFARIALFIIAFIIAFIVSLIVTGFLLEGKLIAVSLEQLNNNLTTSLKVKEIDASLLRSFPKVSIRMKGVEIIEGSLDVPPEFEPGLISIEEVSLRFGIMGLLKKEYNIEEVVLKNGWLNLYFNQEGEGNFKIFKETQKDAKGGWLMEMERIRFQNININYIDIRTGWIFKGLLQDLTTKGQATSDFVLLNIAADIQVGILRQGNFHYLRNQKTSFETELLVSDDVVDLSNSNAKIAGSDLNFSGSIGRRIGDPVFLNISSRDMSLELLLAFLSQYNLSLPPKTQTKGSVAFQFSLDGKSKTEEPYKIDLNFASSQLDISIPEKPELFLKSINGSFTNGKLGTSKSSEIILSNFQVESASSNMHGSLKIKNISSPLYHLDIEQSIHMTDLLAWGIDFPVTSGTISGSIEALGRLQTIEKISLNHFENSKIFADLTITSWDFKEAGRIPDLKSVSGNISVKNQDISYSKLTGKLHGSGFETELQATNAGGIFFGNRKAIINTSITIDSLNTSWLLNQDKDENTEGIYQRSTWDKIHSLSGDIFIDKLVHKNFHLTPLSADMYVKGQNLLCNSFLGRTCDGLLTGKFSMQFLDNDEQLLSADVDLDGMDIAKLFKSFNNFEQDVITSSNISGMIEGSLNFSTPLLKGDMVRHDLKASSNIRVANGRLRDLEQLNSLSRFISLEELQDIKFSTLENNILIENQKVIIPQMDVESSALNLALSGTHSFNGDYTYRFHLLLSDLLFNKFTRNNEEDYKFGYIEDDQTKKAKLYLKLDGNSESHEVSYDGSAAKDAFRQNLREEKESLKGILRDEFKFLDRTRDESAQPSDSIQTQIEEDAPEFTIEWDDEDDQNPMMVP
ncbi:MAG: AsmA-like C-terminal region-containing protein [Bacteroidales bacterium]